MTVIEIVQRSAEFLARKGVESPRLQIELLLSNVLVLPRLQLYLNFERKLSDAEIGKVREMVRRRANREPLQQIVGSANFCGLEIEVTPAVLVPRPETEGLAERAWQCLNGVQKAGDGVSHAVDFGTGSGCLAIAIAAHARQARVTALELSPDAAGVARRNIERHGLADRVQVQIGDGFELLAGAGLAALIVSNPPYIPSAEIAGLQPEVRDHEPRLALDGGADGLDYYRRLAAAARGVLEPGGRIMAEFGDGQAEAIREIFERAGWEVEAVEKDLSGRERILIARPLES